jgi:hypothetical protein
VTITNETLMPDESFARSITINGSIPADSYYEYDAAAGTLVNELGANKFAQLDTTSTQLQLRDSTNAMTIVAATASGITPRFDVIYQDTWV